MGEYNFDGGFGVFVGNDNLGADGGGEALLSFGVKGRPQGSKVARFVSDGID